jgi:hypothetical protein
MPETTNNSIVNIDLTKPATILIQKISNAIEGIAKPRQIKRVAKGEGRSSGHCD